MQGMIGLDWGTTQLRAMLFDGGGAVLETRRRPWGIRQLPEGGFDAALASICAGWPNAPILAAGMVGSRQGWRETAYVDTPASLDALAAGIVTVRGTDGREVAIVPGVRDGCGPDMMRGEETQVFGVLDGYPPPLRDTCMLLPGTHSKWVQVRDRRIVRITTMMTGELYALLRGHSILGAGIPGAPVPPQQTQSFEATTFEAGVRTARHSGGAGALTRLFSTRALMLDGRLAPAAIPDYLSGLLIGEELRGARASGWLNGRNAPLLVGDEALCARYSRAIALFDLPQPVAIADASARGLWRIASAAALTNGSAMTCGEP
jgi:2-dehydro-3-deoxygalactonokinase